jgi:hypothetical protein
MESRYRAASTLPTRANHDVEDSVALVADPQEVHVPCRMVVMLVAIRVGKVLNNEL